MGVTLTIAGESLIARLQAEGLPLIIDRFLFAHLPGLDPAEPPDPDQGRPETPVHDALIPPEYRAFVNPSQVVYSCLLGSDIGDFSFNWQGLYCSEHDTLVAVATFAALDKRAYDPDTNTPGNNLTRNFILTFSGARELTGITVEAAVWQLDFTVRLKSIDERERLSNRDIYGRSSFLEDGWRLVKNGDGYALLPGVGYVEGIRVCLEQETPVYPQSLPARVWLDVAMVPEGSDVLAVAEVMVRPADEVREDYVTAAPYRVPHYLEPVAHIDAAGNVSSLRPGRPADAYVPKTTAIHVADPLMGGGSLTGDVYLSLAATEMAIGGKLILRDNNARAQVAGPSVDGDIANKWYVDSSVANYVGPYVENYVGPYVANYVERKRYELCEVYYFRSPTLRPGFQPAQGGLLENAATLYPEAWAYLHTEEGQRLCASEETWQALTRSIWITLGNGTQVGWNGIGGAPYFALHTDTGALRLPDLRGMYAEAAGFDDLSVGGAHGDAIRRITGQFSASDDNGSTPAEGAFYNHSQGGTGQGGNVREWVIGFDSGRVVPYANKNQPRAWGALACVYLGR